MRFLVLRTLLSSCCLRFNLLTLEEYNGITRRPPEGCRLEAYACRTPGPRKKIKKKSRRMRNFSVPCIPTAFLYLFLKFLLLIYFQAAARVSSRACPRRSKRLTVTLPGARMSFGGLRCCVTVPVFERHHDARGRVPTASRCQSPVVCGARLCRSSS